MNKYNKIIFVLFILYFLIIPVSATIQVVASNTVRNTSLPNPNSASPAVYTTINTLDVGDISGTINVSFDCQGIDGGGGGSGKCRLYSNTSAVGTEYALTGSYVTHVETFSTTQFPDGIMYLKGYVDTPADDSVSIQNFRLMYDYDPSFYIVPTFASLNYNNTIINYDTNRVVLSPIVTDYLSWWRFDSASGCVESPLYNYSNCINNQNQSNSGGVWHNTGETLIINSTDGVYGNGLSFNGTTEYVSFGNSSIYNITGSITVGVWVNGTSAPATETIFGKIIESPSTNGFRLLTGTTNQAFWRVYNAGSSFGGNSITLINDSIPHYLVGEYNGSYSCIYVDNMDTPEGCTAFSGLIQYTNTYLIAGARLNATSIVVENYAGKIDEPIIFSRALNSSERWSIKNQTKVLSGNVSTSVLDNGVLSNVLVDGTLNNNSSIDIYSNTSNDNITFSGDFLEQTNASMGLIYDINASNQKQYFYITINLKGNGSSSPEISNITTFISDFINIIYPTENSIIQRYNNTHGNIQISGSFVGNTTTIEASFNGGDWQNITTDNSSFNGTLYNQSVGQGTVSVRLYNSSSLISNISNVGIGDVFLVAGQSNSQCVGYNSSSLNNSNIYFASSFNNGSTWVIANDPYVCYQNGGAYSSTFDKWYNGSVYTYLANHMIQNLSIPIGFIQTGVGGSSISTWLVGQSNWNNMTTQIDLATNYTRTGVRAVLWYQGEADTSGYTYDQYYQNLTNLVNNFTNTTNATVFIAQIGEITYPSSPNRTDMDAIRMAQRDSWNNLSNASVGVTTYDVNLSNGIHFSEDIEVQELALRWWRVINNSIYGGTLGRGPQVVSINSTGYGINITFDKSVYLKNNSLNAGGFYIQMPSTILTDLNITSSSTNGNSLTINYDSNIQDANLSLGSLNDGAGANVPVDVYGYPAETIFSYNVGNDTTPSASINNLINTTTETSINWTWTNPTDADFNYTIIYINGVFQTNTSNTSYLLQGLNLGDTRTISTHTVDINGNINQTWVNQTTTTSSTPATPSGNIPLDTAFPVWVVMMPFLMVMIVYVLIKGFGQMSIWEYVVAALIIGVAIVFLIDNI